MNECTKWKRKTNNKPCVQKNYLFIRGPMGDVYVCICSMHCFYIRFVRSKTRRDARSILQCSAMLRMHVGIYMCTYTYAWVYMCVHATNTNLYMYVGAACGACVNKNTNKLSAVHNYVLFMIFPWKVCRGGIIWCILFHIMLFMIFSWKDCRCFSWKVFRCFSWKDCRCFSYDAFHDIPMKGLQRGMIWGMFFILCFSDIFHIMLFIMFFFMKGLQMLFMIFPWKVCRGAYYAADTKVGNLGHMFSYFSVPI